MRSEQIKVFLKGRLWGGVKIPALLSLAGMSHTKQDLPEVCQLLADHRALYQEFGFIDLLFLIRTQFRAVIEVLYVIGNQLRVIHPEGGPRWDVFQKRDPFLTHLMLPLDVGNDVQLFNGFQGALGVGIKNPDGVHLIVEKVDPAWVS
jgi:hypothetical protein